MKAPPKIPADLEGAPTVSGGRYAPAGLFLERAEYVSSDYARRLVLEFDWSRAAADLPPWGVRLYVGRPHEAHGVAWRLARRKTWAPSQRQAFDRTRRFMDGAA
jgi:hypothetical protein